MILKQIIWLVIAIAMAFSWQIEAQTWTQVGGNNGWESVASSADGSKLVAVANGIIITSADSGNSRIYAGAPSNEWYSVASSADGNKLVAAVYEGGIYTSTNS